MGRTIGGVEGPYRGCARVIEARHGFAGMGRTIGGVEGPYRGCARVIEARHGFAGMGRTIGGVEGPYRGCAREIGRASWRERGEMWGGGWDVKEERAVEQER